MIVRTGVCRGIRAWTCPVCGWKARLSTKKRHEQTQQPLSREEQIATLAWQAERHFRERHRTVFVD